LLRVGLGQHALGDQLPQQASVAGAFEAGQQTLFVPGREHVLGHGDPARRGQVEALPQQANQVRLAHPGPPTQPHLQGFELGEEQPAPLETGQLLHQGLRCSEGPEQEFAAARAQAMPDGNQEACQQPTSIPPGTL
jgi:hypothetical protein